MLNNMKAVYRDGLKLAYERQGQGVPLVLVHGFPLDHTIWKAVIPGLENAFDLILPDLRGFGASGVSPAPYLLSDMAEDLACLLDELGIKETLMAGHSMGGYVALAFARAFPKRLLGLGLVASQVLADSAEKKAGRQEQAIDILAHGVKNLAEEMAVKLTADPALQAELKQLILRQSPEGVAGALRAMAERPDSTGILANFGFPVVFVHGKADRLIPIETARKAQAMVKKGALVEIAEAGHMPMMEAQSAIVEALRDLQLQAA
jgi:3-oxoadipate enol-lactonase